MTVDSAASVACACRPGNYDDGWQEQRCVACEQREREAWGRAMEAGRRIAQSLRSAPYRSEDQQ